MLPTGELHVWQADLDAGPGDESALSAEERARAARMLGKAQPRFVRSRELLRRLLAAYGAGPAESIRIEIGAEGKPRLAEGPVHFSLAHTGAFWIAAFAADRDVGIDAERTDRDVDRDRVAARIFAAGEIEALRGLAGAAKARGFFRAWTVREAIVKVRGEGMFTLSARLEVEVDPSRELSVRAASASGPAPWVAEVPVPEGYLAAVAAEGAPHACRHFAF